LPFQTSGAQRASSTSRIRLFVLPLVALALAVGSAAFQPQATVAASGVKVVIVVGPVEGQTAKYIRNARSYAATARALGATVTEIYSPRATWARVKAAAQGANIFIYLGHGNGYPSPYGAFRATTKDGLGLNATSGHGNYNNKYYGESYVKKYIKFDKNAVVLLNHLCYAAGNSEPGRANPTKSAAKTRVDYFAGGFIRAGARAVFANGKDSLTSIIRQLLTSDRNFSQIFVADPAFSGRADFHFGSKRTPGYTAWLDPYAAGRYYHSVVGKLSTSASAVRAGS
jgi:hypothetical protein